MKWVSVISRDTVLESAIKECVEQISKSLPASDVDVLFVFTSPDFYDDYQVMLSALLSQFNNAHIIGCSAGGVIGGGLEIEQEVALAITGASLPDVDISTFTVTASELPDPDSGPNSWYQTVNVPLERQADFVILADPFSFPTDDFLRGMDFAYPNSVKIGGLASGAGRAGMNSLFVDGNVINNGAIGIAFSGNISIETIVAQGCKPIGNVMRITESDGNVLKSLDDKNPMTVLRDLYASLDADNQKLMQNSLFVGVVMDGFIDSPTHGDFLMRNIMGLDNNSGFLSVGELLKEGQLIQFHLRDANTSSEDLDALLKKFSTENDSNSSGALLFSCLGRGKYLYGTDNYDSGIFDKYLSGTPLTGFFCNGEIGPVSGTTYIHGYTSSFGIFKTGKS